MEENNLKTILLKAHKRDRIVTLIHYLIKSATVVLGLLVALFIFKVLEPNAEPALDSPGGESPLYNYISYFLISAMVIAAAYPFYRLIKGERRVREIDRLVHCVEIGGKAHTLKEYKKHRISISIGEKKADYFPVNYLVTIMDNDNRPFYMPVYKEDMGNVKKILGRSNASEVVLSNAAARKFNTRKNNQRKRWHIH